MRCLGPARIRIPCDVEKLEPFLKALKSIKSAVSAQVPPEFPQGPWELAIGVAALGAVALGAVVLWRALTEGQNPLQTIAPIAAAADGKDDPAVDDAVNCSVFAPRRVAPRGKFKVQAYLHLLEDWTKVEQEASAIDSTASRRGFESLTRPIARGALVDLLLFCDDLVITKPKRQLRWEGKSASQVFEVEAQTDLVSDSIEAALHVHVDGIPVGRIDFKVYIEPEVPISDWVTASRRPAEHRAETHAARYRKAFVSYSRADFYDVSFFAQCAELQQVELLMDVVTLEPGQEWEKELPAQIARADVFYLMWSDNAAKSEWVDKEARQAKRLYDGSYPHRPSIEPVALYRPIPKPPDYLEKLEFNSVWTDRRTAHRVPLFDVAPR